VLTDSRTGKPAGACQRRSGAAGFTERAAPVNRQVGVLLREPPLHHMTAMQDLQIGWLGGLWPRKTGVATMLERVALKQQQEVVLKLDI